MPIGTYTIINDSRTRFLSRASSHIAILAQAQDGSSRGPHRTSTLQVVRGLASAIVVVRLVPDLVLRSLRKDDCRSARASLPSLRVRGPT